MDANADAGHAWDVLHIMFRSIVPGATPGKKWVRAARERAGLIISATSRLVTVKPEDAHAGWLRAVYEVRCLLLHFRGDGCRREPAGPLRQAGAAPRGAHGARGGGGSTHCRGDGDVKSHCRGDGDVK